jgi:hypothetical protein
VSFGVTYRGFGPEAFAAFETRKWASNLYNMERMAVRDQLRSLGAMLQPAMTAGRAFRWDVTGHSPSVFNAKRVSELVLYFTRTEEQQKALAPLLDSRIALPEQIADAGEQHRHAALGVRIDAGRVEAGLLLHSTAWLDVMNLLNRSRQPAEASQLVAGLRSLPAGSVVRIGRDVEVPTGELTAGHLDRLEAAVLNDTFLIFAGQVYAAGDDRLSSPGFPGMVREVLERALPLWDFIAWQPSADFLTPASRGRDVSASVLAVTPHAMDVATGVKVRLVDGAFAGREGLVTEIDPKGHLRVLIGKVNIRTDVRSVRAI